MATSLFTLKGVIVVTTAVVILAAVAVGVYFAITAIGKSSDTNTENDETTTTNNGDEVPVGTVENVNVSLGGRFPVSSLGVSHDYSAPPTHLTSLHIRKGEIQSDRYKLKRANATKYLKGYIYAEIAGDAVIPDPLVAADPNYQQPFGYPGLAIQVALNTETFAMSLVGQVMFKTIRTAGVDPEDDGLNYLIIRVTVTDASVSPNVTYTGQLTNHKIQHDDTSLPSISLVPTIGVTTTTSLNVEFTREILANVGGTHGQNQGEIRISLFSGADQTESEAATTQVGTSILLDSDNLYNGNDTTVTVSFGFDEGEFLGPDERWLMLRLLVGPGNGIGVGESAGVQLNSTNAGSSVFFTINAIKATTTFTLVSGVAEFSFTIADITGVVAGSTEAERLDNINVKMTLSNVADGGVYTQSKNCRTDLSEHATEGKGALDSTVTSNTIGAVYNSAKSNQFTDLGGDTDKQFTINLDIYDESFDPEKLILTGVSSAFDILSTGTVNVPLAFRMVSSIKSSLTITGYKAGVGSNGGGAIGDGSPVSLLDSTYTDVAGTAQTSVAGSVTYSIAATDYAIKITDIAGTQSILTAPITLGALDVLNVNVELVEDTGKSHVPFLIKNADTLASDSATVANDASPQISGAVNSNGYTVLTVDQGSQTFSVTDNAPNGGGGSETANSTINPNTRFFSLQTITTAGSATAYDDTFRFLFNRSSYGYVLPAASGNDTLTMQNSTTLSTNVPTNSCVLMRVTSGSSRTPHATQSLVRNEPYLICDWTSMQAGNSARILTSGATISRDDTFTWGLLSDTGNYPVYVYPRYHEDDEELSFPPAAGNYIILSINAPVALTTTPSLMDNTTADYIGYDSTNHTLIASRFANVWLKTPT